VAFVFDKYEVPYELMPKYVLDQIPSPDPPADESGVVEGNDTAEPVAVETQEDSQSATSALLAADKTEIETVVSKPNPSSRLKESLAVWSFSNSFVISFRKRIVHSLPQRKRFQIQHGKEYPKMTTRLSEFLSHFEVDLR
jgi:hypothetical protein